MNTVPYQSTTQNVRFPGIALAAKDLGVTRTHLWRVLTGKRESPGLKTRWQNWLTKNPEFKTLQK